MGNPFRWLALALAVLALSVACAARPAPPSAALLKEVAPSGTLRVGVVVGPARSAFFAVQEQGQPSGVTVELGTQLAQKLGVPVEITSPTARCIHWVGICRRWPSSASGTARSGS
jgi:ABC-type amino acid transport substrate-binding protein